MINLVEFDGALIWWSGFNVDADGSPHAYAPEGGGPHGLDYLANAGNPGNWYGIVCYDGGHPVIQGPRDPAPGYYVSATALQDHSRAETDPLRYVDSEQIPYVSVPRDVGRGVGLGDYAYVVRNNKSSGAIVADVGPKGKFGEGSIALAQTLLIPSSPKNGGCDSGVAYVVFPGSRRSPPWPIDLDILLRTARDHFNAWGGFNKLAQV